MIGKDGFTYQLRRVEWQVVYYTVDQYGMPNKLSEQTLSRWPSRELALADLPNHGYEHKYVTNRWIPNNSKHDYEQISVAYREVVIPPEEALTVLSVL